MGHDDIQIHEADLQAARERGERLRKVLGLVGLLIVALGTIPAAAIGELLADGTAKWPMIGLAAAVMGYPVLTLTRRAGEQEAAKTAEAMDSLRAELTEALREAEDQADSREAQARRQEFESQLANALEMGDGEPEIIDVVERAFTTTLPGVPVELLLADNSHAHLTRMAVSPAVDGQAMCSVDSPDRCPAARRAQVQRFPDSEALDACPKLRGRAEGACAAVCVPVSIMGRTVGVIHATGEPGTEFDEMAVQDLGTLANLAGARIGLLRMVADTQLQASTDSLTGLINRRSLENRFFEVRAEGGLMSVVMADLDHFKLLNDTHGHGTGDRALRVFAQTLAATLRTDDLVCRHGGEEFAVVLPSCSADDAATAIGNVRTAVASAVAQAGLPAFTASFGVVESEPHEDLADVLARADVALFQAKRDGRDRVVVHDVTGNEVVTSTEAARRESRGNDFAVPPDLAFLDASS